MKSRSPAAIACRLSFLATNLLCCAAAARAADYSYSVLMQVGDPVPGTNAKLNDLQTPPRLTPTGDAVVNATLLPTSGPQFRAVVQRKGGALRAVAQQYKPSPSGQNLAGIGALLVQDDAGHVLFNGTEGDDVFSSNAKECLFGEDATGLHLVARKGDSKLESTFTSDLGSPSKYVFSNSGVIAFNKIIKFGPDAHESLWMGTPTTLTRIARQTEAPPGTVQIPNPNPGFPLRGWRNFSNPQISSSGRLVFGASVQINGPQTFDGDGVWAFGSGEIGDLYINPQTLVPLPTPPGGLPYGIEFTGAGGAGPILITQSVKTDTVGNHAVLFSNADGPLKYEAGLSGIAPAPDAIVNLGGAARMSSIGRIAVILDVPSANQNTGQFLIPGFGIAAGKNGDYSLIALNNQPAPGLPEGVKFKLQDSTAERGLALSPNGGLVFLTELQGTGVTSANNQAIWYSPPDGATLKLVARTGEPMALAGGVARTPTNFEMIAVSGGDDGLPRCHNDAGQVAFLANFTSGPEAVILASPGGGTGPDPDTAPVATNDTLSIRGATKLDVLANDSDPDDDPLKITAVTKPTKGTARINAGKTITYTPGKTFDGTDTFSYTITANGETSTATVTVTNPFLGLRGSYSQIVTANSAPLGTLSAKVTPSGGLTGKFIISGKSYILRGNIGFDGVYTQTFKRKPAGTPDLVVTLSFIHPGGIAMVSGSATGDVPPYIIGQSEVALTELPDGLEKSAFTVLLPADASAAHPRGYGWATAKLAANGKLTLAGKLADGTPFTTSAALSKYNKARIFIPLYKKPKGSLAGTLEFSTGPARFAGTLTWTKPAQDKPGTLFPDGFTATTEAAGALYSAPKNAPLLTFPTPAAPQVTITASGGDGALDLSADGTMTAAGKTAFNPNEPKFKISISRANGKFAGSFLPAAGAKPLKFSGVLQQGVNFGAGAFVTPGQSGAVRLLPRVVPQ